MHLIECVAFRCPWEATEGLGYPVSLHRGWEGVDITFSLPQPKFCLLFDGGKEGLC